MNRLGFLAIKPGKWGVDKKWIVEEIPRGKQLAIGKKANNAGSSLNAIGK